MRVTIFDKTPGHTGVISHEHTFEPILLTLTGPELAAMVNGRRPEVAFDAGALSTLAVFPPEMPEEERSKFMEACAQYIPGHPTLKRDFGWALAMLRAGRKVSREGWNGKGMFLFLVPGSTFQVNRPPLLGIYPEGTEIQYHPHIDMKTAQGYVVPWLASQADMLAEDWGIVEQ